MIDFGRRPLAGHPQPSQAMGFVPPIVHADVYDRMPLGRGTANALAPSRFALFAPCKQAGCGIVVEKFAESSCGDRFSVSHVCSNPAVVGQARQAIRATCRAAMMA